MKHKAQTKVPFKSHLGFGIIENMVAIVIIMTSVMALAAFTSSSIRMNGFTRQHTEAMVQVRSIIESYRSQPTVPLLVQAFGKPLEQVAVGEEAPGPMQLPAGSPYQVTIKAVRESYAGAPMVAHLTVKYQAKRFGLTKSEREFETVIGTIQ